MKKQKTALIAAAAGVCVFTTAAFANYSASNGYDGLKKSLWGLLESQNFTTNANLTMKLDGNEEENAQFYTEYGADVKRIYSRRSGTTSYGSQYTSESYEDAQKAVSAMNDGTYLVFENKGRTFDSVLGSMTGNEDSSRKVFRFIELCADTVVGDLRNNVNYVGDEDGKPSYSINLTSVQIPEIVQTGLSAMVAVSNANTQYVNEDGVQDLDAMMNTMVDAYVDGINGSFTLNEDGTLDKGAFDIAFTATDAVGNQHTLELALNAAFSNYGTTDPQTIDLTQIDSSKIEYINYDDNGIYSYPDKTEDAVE